MIHDIKEFDDLEATPTKLRSGKWGARIAVSEGRCAIVGDGVVVRTRAGKTWEAVVTKIVWQNDDVQIVETASSKSDLILMTRVNQDEAEEVASEGQDRPVARSYVNQGCRACRQTETRRSQIWEECDHCGAEPVYV